MELTLPTWFKYRQGKAEPAGADTYRLSAPNAAEAFISIRRSEADRYAAVLRTTANGPEVDATSAEFDKARDAWSAAFELYRSHVLI
jgi:hypothetical protein